MAPSMECNGAGFGSEAEGMEQERGRRFSIEEVAVHSGEHDAWIVVDGEVYDVTEFLQSHPGGPEVSRKLYPILFLAVDIQNSRSRDLFFSLCMCGGR